MIYIIIGILVFILVLIMIMVRTKKKKKSEEERNDKYENKRMEQKLDERLENHQLKDKKAHNKVAVPIHVDYSEGGKRSTDENANHSDFMIRIIEKNKLSKKEFVLDASEGIYIGSDKSSNNIVIYDEIVSTRHIHIYVAGEGLCVKNVGSGVRVLLARKSKKAILEGDPFYLKTGDTIIIGSYSYKIEF